VEINIIQNKVFETIPETLNNIKKIIEKHNLDNSDFIVLPEMFSTPYEHKYFKDYAQTLNGEVINFLKKLAIDYHTYVVGGSIPYIENDSLFNTTFVFNRDGQIIARYDKIHLFEITYPDGKHFSESDILNAGDKPVVFDTEFGKMGLMICFDVRFPYLASALMEKDVKVIFVPAAFNNFTGPLHWQTTFRARAIDNQLFMVGVSPSSDSFGNYNIYGHSTVVDPYGRVMVELSDKEMIISINVNLDYIEHARKHIPIIAKRKKI